MDKPKDYLHRRTFGMGGGDCGLVREHKIPFQDQTLLALEKREWIVVPGYLLREKYRTNYAGLPVSEVRPIDKPQRPGVEEVVRKHFEEIEGDAGEKPGRKIQIHFW